MLRNVLRSRSARWLAAPVTLAAVAALLTSALTASPASATTYVQLDYGYTGPIYGYGGLCLDDRGDINANRNPVQLYPCNGTAAQQWQVIYVNGFHQILLLSSKNSFPKCLDAEGESLSPGTPVEIYQCTGGRNQTWEPQPGGALDNQYTGSNACLDDPNRSTSQAQLELWSCNGGPNQTWLGGYF